MNTPQNNTILIAVLTLAIGLGIGYFAGGIKSSLQTSIDTSSDMHGAMAGMTMGLEGKEGDALDKAFLDEMIVHHEGAIEMAKTLLKGTKRPELTKLGNDIITAQTQEIEAMKQWRKDWFQK